MTDVEDRLVEAGAEKRFFIEMLTRDIELLPAVVDLVDNSVDGARRTHPDGNLDGQWVEVSTSHESFSISDNSGGIAADVARHYAFRFGRPTSFPGVRRSVGQFGVGMKRAIFKLGEHFRVESTYRANADIEGIAYPDSRFSLEVDVPTWAANDSWTFQFESVEEGIKLDSVAVAGTAVSVTSLHPSVADDLSDGAVIDSLERELRIRHQEAIHRGLQLSVNGKPLLATRPSLQHSELVRPIVRSLEVDGGSGVVAVRIFAGTTKAQRTRDGAEDVDIGEATNFQEAGDAGWYLFCNDRLLMVADRSALTGWGSPAASYHPQYRHFRGYVYLAADDAALLPWNTTKTAVDRDSPVFRAVANEMKTTLVAVQAAINREKNVRASYTVALRDAESAGHDLPERPVLVEAMEDADDTPLGELPESSQMVVPPPPANKPKPAPPPPNIKRIQYEVDLDLFERVASALTATSGSEVGRLTFEYFVEEELD